MRRLVLFAAFIGGSLFGICPAGAADSKEDKDSLPAPRPIAPIPMVSEAPPLRPVPWPPFQRPNPYERMQSFAVDHSSGRLYLRVIDSPYGVYYHYDGRPYPWPLTNQQWYRIQTSEPANFQGAVQTPRPLPPANFQGAIQTPRPSPPADFMPYAED